MNTFFANLTTSVRRNPLLALLIVVAALLLVQQPLLPEGGLDASWVLANEHARQIGARFGIDFVFTYGPLGFLSTHFFDPATFGWTILCDLALAGIYLYPLRWCRTRSVVLLYLLGVLVAGLSPLAYDARILGVLLVIFLAAMRGDRLAPIGAAVLVPVFLSKFSYIAAALPLFLLADLATAIRFRRMPLLTLICLLGVPAGLLLSGLPAAQLPQALGNVSQVVSGYGGAMQYAIGGAIPLLIAFAAMTATAAIYGYMILRRRPQLAERLSWQVAAATWLGVAWIPFTAYKMGHVRQDLHMQVTWSSFVIVLAPIWAHLRILDRGLPLERYAIAALALASFVPVIALDGALFVLGSHQRPITYPIKRPIEVLAHGAQTLGWLLPWQWQATEQRRVAATQRLAQLLPAGVRGSVDVVPSELAPAIVGAAPFAPRPVPQSYSAYTPHLQQLDLAHFQDSARAPGTLFYQATDIDNRLPTLALGPTLPILAQWYDLGGVTPLGLELYRRATPRPVRRTTLGERSFRIGEWVDAPRLDTGMLVTRIDIAPNLLGKAIGLLGREPMLFITIRYADGSERDFRFIPGMAKLGFILSPMPKVQDGSDPLAAAEMLQYRPSSGRAQRVRAYRLHGSAFANVGYTAPNIAFEQVMTTGR